MKRRTLIALAGMGALAGCGFKLRQPPDFAFDVIQLTGASALINELRRNLVGSGKVTVVSAAPTLPAPSTIAAPQAPASAPAPAAPNAVILEILQEQREKAVVSLNASGQVREFQLRLRLKFRLRTPSGRELIPETELLQLRDVSFNESAVLAKETEESLLYLDMQTDIVQQLMRRLAAIKTI